MLGVDPEATPEQIKTAYRHKVKELHPDYYGQDSGPFRAVQEAYNVLGDPERRRKYDEARQRSAHRSAAGSVRGTSWPSRPGPVEPLIPEPEQSSFNEPLFSPPPLTFNSLFQNLFDPWREWPTPPAHFHIRPGEIYLELTLMAEQAQMGGKVQIELPLQGPCQTCNGSGEIVFYGCWDCRGTGITRIEYPLLLTFPAGILQGEIFKVSLDDLGLQADLFIRFNIEVT